MKAEEHRLCQICWVESEDISNYIKNNFISFGNMSQVGRDWLEVISADVPIERKK